MKFARHSKSLLLMPTSNYKVVSVQYNTVFSFSAPTDSMVEFTIYHPFIQIMCVGREKQGCPILVLEYHYEYFRCFSTIDVTSYVKGKCPTYIKKINKLFGTLTFAMKYQFTQQCFYCYMKNSIPFD